ncbi:MAG: MFS transporter [Candidatus Methanodesulfokora sp.]
MKYRNIKFLLVALFIESFAVAYLVGYYLNIALYDIGGAELVGLYSMLNGISLSLVPIIGGTFSDSLGRRRTIVLSMTVGAFCLLALSALVLSRSASAVLPAALLNAMFIFASPAINALASESVSKEYIGRTLSLLFFVDRFASIISYLTFGIASAFLEEYKLFIASTIAFSISIVPYLCVQETFVRRSQLRLNPLSGIFEGIRFAKQRLKLFLVYIALDSFLSSIAAPFVAVFLRDVHNLTVPEISKLYSLIGFLTLAGALVAGLVVDRCGSLVSLIINDSLSIPLLILFTFPMPVAAVSLAISAFIEQLRVASDRFIVEKTEQRHRALMLGLKRTLMGLCGVPGPLIGALI